MSTNETCKAHMVSGRHLHSAPCQLTGTSSPRPRRKQRCHPHHVLGASAEPHGTRKETGSCAEFWSSEHKLCSSCRVLYVVSSAAYPDRVTTCFFLIRILFVCVVLDLSLFKYLVSGNHTVYDAIHTAHILSYKPTELNYISHLKISGSALSQFNPDKGCPWSHPWALPWAGRHRDGSEALHVCAAPWRWSRLAKFCHFFLWCILVRFAGASPIRNTLGLWALCWGGTTAKQFLDGSQKHHAWVPSE